MNSEKVNKIICDKLSQLTFTQYIKLLGEKPIINKGQKQEYDKVKVQYKLMKRYTNFLRKNNYKKEVEYNIANKEYGRQVAIGDSLQKLNRKIRGVLCLDTLTDYDIENAQPTILKELCKEKGLVCFNLEKYTSYREKVIEELQSELFLTREEVKNLIISCLFSETCIYNVGKKKIKNTYFLELQKEIKNIQEYFYINNPDLVLYLKKKGKTKNLKGSLLSHILATKENEILEYVINKFKCNVKIFDGFLSDHVHDIEEINNYCSLKYKVKWTKKDLNLDILEELLELDISDNILSFVGDSVKDIALYLLENKFTKLFICYDEFYFHNGNIWINKEKELKRLLKCEISKCDLYQETAKGFICINDNVKGVNDTYEFIINHTPRNDDLINNIWNNSINKLFYKNGYYDFKDGKFKNDNRDTTIYITKNLNMKSNPKIRKEIYDRILNPIFSENEIIRDSFLYEMSQTIAGNYQRKIWYCLEGVRNSGKGIISDCLFNSFQNYVSITNADNFIYKDSNGDSAKSLSFLTDFEFSRLVITQEISLKENGKTLLDGNRIKKFVSGGDKVEARKNYQDEKRFKLQCSLMLCCNDLPIRQPGDCNEFLKHYLFNSKFIGSNEEKKYDYIKYYEKDETLKSDFLIREEVINEFTLILLDHYNKKVELPKQEEEIEEADDTAKLFNMFEFTNKSSDKISNSDLYYSILEVHKIPFTKNKISRLLKSKGAKNITENNKRGFSCIKFKEEGDFN